MSLDMETFGRVVLEDARAASEFPRDREGYLAAVAEHVGIEAEYLDTLTAPDYGVLFASVQANGMDETLQRLVCMGLSLGVRFGRLQVQDA